MEVYNWENLAAKSGAKKAERQTFRKDFLD